MQITLPAKGIDFNSPHTDNEAITRFQKYVRTEAITGNFANSLYMTRRLTQNQLPWVHILVAQHEGTPTKPKVVTNISLNLKAIHDHISNCRKNRSEGGKGLLNPMVGLLVGTTHVVLKLAGANSKHFGKVSVASSHKYGEGDFYGWIDTDGTWQPSRNGTPTTVIDILTRVNSDPARVISEIGKESGRCCYCFAELTTVQSKIAGAGKTCSEKWSLEYPSVSFTRVYVLDHPEILEGTSDREKWEQSLQLN